MSKTKVIVRMHTHSLAANEPVVMISQNVVRKWKIPSQQTVQLHFGAARETVHVAAIPTRSELRMSSELIRRFGLPPQGTTLRLAYRPAARILRIGPLLGVMVPKVTQTPGRRFGIITPFCREITEACRAQGAFVYFFTPDEARSTQDTINGWSLHGNEYAARFPIPDVIYNRLPSRKLDGKPGLQEFLGTARKRWNTSVFNEKYLDKTEVFQALKNYAGAIRYLPESWSFTKASQLRTMLSKYRTVFLKPIRGSLGKGILRITRTKSGYELSSSAAGGARKLRFASLSGLIAAISGKLKTTRYQIQQGLDLITVGGRPVDFRALVQKSIGGEWKVTSIVARTAGTHRFVSNVAQGGTVGTVSQTVAKSNLTKNRSGVSTRLHRAALNIAKGIDERIPAHFGELGVDLALDRTGRVWLLEVNSKPSKNDSSLLSERKIRPSVKHLVQYARHLANL